MKWFKRVVARLLGIHNVSLIPVVDELGESFKKGLEEGLKNASVGIINPNEFTVEQTTKNGTVKQKDDCPIKITISVDSKHIASTIVEDVNRLMGEQIKNKNMFY